MAAPLGHLRFVNGLSGGEYKAGFFGYFKSLNLLRCFAGLL